VEEAADRKSGH